MIPALTTKRLLLRPYYAGMVTEDHVRWLNDPEVVRYSEQRHKRHTIESTHIYVNGLWMQSNSFIWGINIQVGVLEEEPYYLPIGTITAHVDKPNGVANIGIMIGEKSEWGKGYGQESWLTICNWLFDNKDVRKIEMGCHYENRAMRELALTCGMHLEGVRHDHFVVDGEPQHLLLYAKMKPARAQVSVNESSTA
jgi:RimJ/RimL family protein N-acetyltransferase